MTNPYPPGTFAAEAWEVEAAARALRDELLRQFARLCWHATRGRIGLP